MKDSSEHDSKQKISLAPANKSVGAMERAFLAEARTPDEPGYDAKVDLEAMRDMRQVLENRLRTPAQYRARGATNETEILLAPEQFPELHDYPKNLPVVVQNSLKDANGPDSTRQAEYLQHVQNAITAATENVDPTVAGLPNAVGWVQTPPSGKANMPQSDFYSLGDVGGNTFYGLLTGQLPKAKPSSNTDDLKGKTLLEQIRHHADEARADAAKKRVPPYMELHQQIMSLVRPQFSVAPIPGSPARPGGATRFGGAAGTASPAAHGAGPTSYAPRSASPFQGGTNGVPAQQAPAATPAVYAGTGRPATASGIPAAGGGDARYGAPGATPVMAANGSASHRLVSEPGDDEAHVPFQMWHGRPEEFTREEERLIIQWLEADSRLPPRGTTGFDPALTPAWPGRPMRF